MEKVSIIKLFILISVISLLVSCDSLELGDSNQDDSFKNTETTNITNDTTVGNSDLLIEFKDYTTSKNDDGTFNIIINQEAMEGCYYTISLMYDGMVLEYIQGEGYLKSNYGKFANDDDTITTINENTEEYIDTTIVTTSEQDLKSSFGKAGKWTFKTISEGTEYIEINLINSYGDIISKVQFTCIVDTHLEPHMYYTTINF